MFPYTRTKSIEHLLSRDTIIHEEMFLDIEATGDSMMYNLPILTNENMH